MPSDGRSTDPFSVYLTAACLSDSSQLQRELQRELQLPAWYGSNWDALLDCLSSLDDAAETLCRVCRGETPRSLVFCLTAWDEQLLRHDSCRTFLSVVADANSRLASRGATARVWLEFSSATPQPADGDWC
ncbi:MAG: barstar family protein [Planctomycetota bacterium]